MRSPISPVSAWYARLCLSFKIHVVYSVCRIRLSATGFTLPWQLVAAQEPGPIYFCGSPADFADCAPAGIANARIAPVAANAVLKQILEKKFIESWQRISSLISFNARGSQRFTRYLFRVRHEKANSLLFTLRREVISMQGSLQSSSRWLGTMFSRTALFMRDTAP